MAPSDDSDLPHNPELARAARYNGLGDLVDQTQMFPSFPGQTQQIAQPWTFMLGAAYSPFTLNRIGLEYGYLTYGLVQDVIDMPVDDAFRGGIKIESRELDEEDVKLLKQMMEDNGDIKALKLAAKLGKRLCGGGALLAVTDQDPTTPLRPLKKGAALKFIHATRWELPFSNVLTNGLPFDIQGNEVEMPYNYYGVTVDRSRVFRMTGKEAPPLVRARLQGWGMSELERCMREINTYVKFQNLLFELVDEAKIDVYHVEEFNESLATAKGTDSINLRVNISNWLKNYKNALVMDKEDEFDQKQIAFSGLADIFEQFRVSLCATLRIPYNKLFGMSATGFASGEDSMENYNAMIDGEVRDDLRETIRQVLSLRMQATFGFVPEFTFEFAPLRVLTAEQEENVKTAKQARTMDLYDRDLYNGQEAMESLHKEGLVNVDSEVLAGKREPISPLEMQQQAQEVAAKQGDQKLKQDAKKNASRDNAIIRLRRMVDRKLAASLPAMKEAA